MRISHLVPLAAIALCIAHSAHADNKLFPTDMLDKGTFDLNFSLAHEDQSRDVSFNANTGRGSSEFTSEEVELRYGLNNDWLIAADMPYESQAKQKTDYTNPVSHLSNHDNQGGQNPSFWIKYGILDDANSPLTLSARILISPDIGNKKETGYEAEVMAGWRSSDSLRLYSMLDHSINDSDNYPDRTNLEFGAYKDFSENFTLIPHVTFAEIQSIPTSTSIFQYDVGISAHIQVFRNTYLTPGISYFSNAASHDPTNAFRANSSNGKDISVALYHLF